MELNEFEDKNIERCDISETHDGSTAAFLQLDFNHQPLCGIEIMLTKEELESMLKAINDDEENQLFGPVDLEKEKPDKVTIDNCDTIVRFHGANIEIPVKAKVETMNIADLIDKEPAINIVVKHYEDTPDVHFIEVENNKGESIKVGEWIKKNNDGYSYLRIKRSDIK